MALFHAELGWEDRKTDLNADHTFVRRKKKRKKENILGDTTSFITPENESLFIPLFKGDNPG